MCGIIGLATPDPRKDSFQKRSFLEQGLIVDSLRGMGGSGLGLVKTNYEVETYRRALPGMDFINSDVGSLALRDTDLARVAIGHNRAATIGSIKDRNCHPFHYQGKREIMLVHNGTLHSYHAISPPGFNHEVDSAHAAAALAESDNVAATLKKMKGPFVFVWWDGKDKTFNIARNEFRDISYVQTNDGTIYFGSEFKMVDWLLDRASVNLPEDVKYLSLGDNQWFSWELEDGKISPKYKVTDIKAETLLPAIFDRSRHNVRTDLKTESRIAANLSKLGLEEQELIYMKITAFETYGNNFQTGNKERIIGKIIGTSLGVKDNPEVWVHSVAASRYEFLSETFKDEIPIRVKGAYVPGKIPDQLIISAEILAKDLFKHAKKATKSGQLKLSSEVKEILKKEKNTEGSYLSKDAEDSEEDYVTGPNGIYITINAWRKLVRVGCAMCSDVPSEDDHAKIAWISDVNPIAFLCASCGENKEIREAAGPIGKTVEGET